MTDKCATRGRLRFGLAALVASLVFAAGSAPAQPDPGFATLEPVGDGARVGLAASVTRRDTLAGEPAPTLRLDLFGRAPLTLDTGLHARLAAACGPGVRLGPSTGGSGASGLEQVDRFTLYGAHLGVHRVARWRSVVAPLALALVLPTSDPDGFDMSVRGTAFWARIGDYPAGRHGLALRVSGSPTLRYHDVVVRFELGGDVPLSDVDGVGFQVGLRAGLGVAAPVGPLAVMVEGLSYSLFADLLSFRTYTLAFGLRYVDAWLRPSAHAVVPVGESAAREPVWWMLGVDWVMDGPGVSSDRPAAAR